MYLFLLKRPNKQFVLSFNWLSFYFPYGVWKSEYLNTVKYLSNARALIKCLKNLRGPKFLGYVTKLSHGNLGPFLAIFKYCDLFFKDKVNFFMGHRRAAMLSKSELWKPIRFGTIISAYGIPQGIAGIYDVPMDLLINEIPYILPSPWLLLLRNGRKKWSLFYGQIHG